MILEQSCFNYHNKNLLSAKKMISKIKRSLFWSESWFLLQTRKMKERNDYTWTDIKLRVLWKISKWLEETFSLPQILFTFLIDIRFEMNRKCVMSKFRIGIELNSLIKALTLDLVQTRLLHEVWRPELRCNWIISTLLMSFVCNI